MPAFSPASAQTPLSFFATQTGTTGTSTLITVPAGRTWQGTVTIQAISTVAAASTTAGSVLGKVQSFGAGVLPAAGDILGVIALCPAQVAGSLAGTTVTELVSAVVTITAPAANLCKLSYTCTISGTLGQVIFTANGTLL